MDSQASVPQSEWSLRNELLRLVLRDTLKASGVPPKWVGGEAVPGRLRNGGMGLEIRFALTCDEPRFLRYIAEFQADFERRLLSIEPRAHDWLAGISWQLSTDPDNPDPEHALPPPHYWDYVFRDWELTLRQKGRLQWSQEALEQHFENTNPGFLEEDFQDTQPPERSIEDVRPRRD
jgi:hypothetical protein